MCSLPDLCGCLMAGAHAGHRTFALRNIGQEFFRRGAGLPQFYFAGTPLSGSQGSLVKVPPSKGNGWHTGHAAVAAGGSSAEAGAFAAQALPPGHVLLGGTPPPLSTASSTLPPIPEACRGAQLHMPLYSVKQFCSLRPHWNEPLAASEQHYVQRLLADGRRMWITWGYIGRSWERFDGVYLHDICRAQGAQGVVQSPI